MAAASLRAQVDGTRALILAAKGDAVFGGAGLAPDTDAPGAFRRALRPGTGRRVSGR